MTLLRPSGPIHPEAILLDDPGRAMLVAQELIEGPLMANHAFGLWGYHGPCGLTGRPLTVQSYGFGAASLTEVVAQLAAAGTVRLVRIAAWWEAEGGGSAADEAGIDPLPIVIDSAVGASLAGEDHGKASPDPDLTRALGTAAGKRASRGGTASGAVRTPVPGLSKANPEPPLDIRARDDAGATLFRIAPDLGIQAGSILVPPWSGEELPGGGGPVAAAASIAAGALAALDEPG